MHTKTKTKTEPSETMEGNKTFDYQQQNRHLRTQVGVLDEMMAAFSSTNTNINTLIDI